MARIIPHILLAIGVLLTIACGAAVLRGYGLYQDALAQKSLETKVEEVQAGPNYTRLGDMTKTFRDAVVAVEDHRFYQHPGIDIIATCRAIWNDIRSLSLREGGSTITQQLAKNLYFTNEKSFVRKIAELFMAFDLERSYSKDTILELYTNTTYFGDGYYGIREASEGYFGSAPSAMTASQSTLIAGVPNAPSAYAPTENPNLASKRQAHVLDRMVAYGYLTAPEAQVLAVSA